MTRPLVTVRAVPRVSVSVRGAHLPVVAAPPPGVVVIQMGVGGRPGERGPSGATGPAGSGLRINVSAPAATWIIPHDLGRSPAVQTFLADGEQFDADVQASVSTVTVTMASAVAGYVILI